MSAPPDTRELWRHKKTGGLYRVLAYGVLEWDMRNAVIYRLDGDVGVIWIRPESEFRDGRFELVSEPADPERISVTPVSPEQTNKPNRNSEGA